MPLSYYRSRSTGEVSVWKISESEDFFLKSLEEEGFPTGEGREIKHPEKRLQWLASRYLLSMSHPEAIVRRKSRKPGLVNGPAISFSHTANYAALLISHANSGIDIQKLDEKLFLIAPRFVVAGELELIQAHGELEALSLLWSVKEATFKFYETELPFKNIKLLFHDSIENKVEVEVQRRGLKGRHSLHADFLDEITLAYVLE